MGLRMVFIRGEEADKDSGWKKSQISSPSRQEPCGGGQEYKVGE